MFFEQFTLFKVVGIFFFYLQYFPYCLSSFEIAASFRASVSVFAILLVALLPFPFVQFFSFQTTQFL